MPKVENRPEKLIIGGQAVMEGVMMRSKRYYAVAVRKPNKKVTIKIKRLKNAADTYPLLGKPFIRGAVGLFESLVLGMRALTYSANESTDEKEEKLSNREIAITLVIAIALSIGLFVAVPFIVSKYLTSTDFMFNLFDGVLRMVIFLLYIVIISRMDDIQRVFAYHGAEHKTVHTYEAGEKLTVANVRKHSRLHPRCGTTFMLLVVVISIGVFSLIITESTLVKFLARIVLLPVIAGISYEVLRLSAKYTDNTLCKIVMHPGLLLQKLTTREPDDAQIRVAVLSLQCVLDKEDS